MFRAFLIVVFYSFIQLCVGQSVITHKVFFETDSDKLSSTEKQRLLLFSKNLKTLEVQDFQIVGYCDDRGTDTYNLDLSMRRAVVIQNALVKQKHDKALITYVDGKGEVLLRQEDSLSTDNQRGLNRRVDIMVRLEAKNIEENTAIKKSQGLEGELKIGDKIILKDILFRTGYSDVLKESLDNLEKISRILKERKEVSFVILGHVCCTDQGRDAIDRRTKKFNLSVARAKRVYDYFLAQGIEKERMDYKGLGHQFPLGGPSKYDRRVEIEIVKIN